jgi:fused signal recognition particle receptor
MGFFSKLKFWAKPEEEATGPRAAPEAAPGIAPDTAPDGAPAARPAPQEAAVTAGEPWQRELTLALRAAEPRLSQWLALALQGVTEKGPQLWARLEFLFRALGAPEAEARDFTARFSAWLDAMEYRRVEEFRSELQYRLALALDLEDEEDERSRLLLKLSEGWKRPANASPSASTACWRTTRPWTRASGKSWRKS